MKKGLRLWSGSYWKGKRTDNDAVLKDVEEMIKHTERNNPGLLYAMPADEAV